MSIDFEKLLDMVQNPVMRKALEKALKEKVLNSIRSAYKNMFEKIIAKREGRKVYVVYVFRDERMAEAFYRRLMDIAEKVMG